MPVCPALFLLHLSLQLTLAGLGTSLAAPTTPQRWSRPTCPSLFCRVLQLLPDLVLLTDFSLNRQVKRAPPEPGSLPTSAAYFLVSFKVRSSPPPSFFIPASSRTLCSQPPLALLLTAPIQVPFISSHQPHRSLWSIVVLGLEFPSYLRWSAHLPRVHRLLPSLLSSPLSSASPV